MKKVILLTILTLTVPLLNYYIITYQLPRTLTLFYWFLILIFLRIKPEISNFKISFDKWFVIIFLLQILLFIFQIIAFERKIGFIREIDLIFIVSLLLYPFLEEVFFRYYIFNKLKEFSQTKIILISGFLFAISHLMSTDGIFYIFIHGVLFSIYYSKNRSLLMVILMHYLLNLFAIFII